MNPQTEQDIHLIAAPFRIVSGFLKMILMILILPFILVGGIVYSLTTGKPFMSADECVLFQIVLTVLFPVIAAFMYLACAEIKMNHNPTWTRPMHSYWVFLGGIALVIMFAECNSVLGWGYYGSTNQWYTLLPIFVSIVLTYLLLQIGDTSSRTCNTPQSKRPPCPHFADGCLPEVTSCPWCNS